MAFWDDAKKKVMQVMKPRQQEERVPFSNRADGGFSGYQPRMPQVQQDAGTAGYQRGSSGLEGMMPSGVDMSGMQHFQPVGGQTGAMRPMAQGAPRQTVSGQTGYQPQVGQPQGGMNQPNAFAQQSAAPQHNAFPPQGNFAPQGGFAPQSTFAPQGGMNQPNAFAQQSAAPQQGNFVPQGTAQMPAANQNASQTFAFPGGDSYVVDGNAYKMVFRVAQITGVPSCFRVIEFMYNNEAVIVNAEQITDLVEADRCMDLIFGAACAMKQRLMRVSGKQIYLITPPQVYVAPFEGLRKAGMADIERRWPGAMQAGAQVQPVPNNIQPMQPMQPMQPVQQGGFGQPRREDFAGGFGRRTARSAMQANGYTDFGGFKVQ